MHTSLANNLHGLFVASGGNLSSSPAAKAANKAGKVFVATLAIAGMGLTAAGCSTPGNQRYSPNYSSAGSSAGNCGNGSGNCKSVEQDAIDRRINTWKSQAEDQKSQDEQSNFNKATPEQQMWYLQHR